MDKGKFEEAMEMLYKAKWNVPKAADHCGLTLDSCKELFSGYCLSKPFDTLNTHGH